MDNSTPATTTNSAATRYSKPTIHIRVTTNARQIADQLAALRRSPDAMTVTHDRATEK